MNSKDFLKDAIAPIQPIGTAGTNAGGSALDQAISDVNTPKQPGAIKQAINSLTGDFADDPAAGGYTSSKAGNALGRIGAGAAKIAGQGVSAANKAIELGRQTSMTGSAFSNKIGTQAQADAAFTPGASKNISANPNAPDADMIEYLKSASGGQPLRQATGNAGLDTLLKNAGLLK